MFYIDLPGFTFNLSMKIGVEGELRFPKMQDLMAVDIEVLWAGVSDDSSVINICSTLAMSSWLVASSICGKKSVFNVDGHIRGNLSTLIPRYSSTEYTHSTTEMRKILKFKNVLV